MSVNASCGKCDIPLENSHISLGDGTQVQVSKCPSCEGSKNLLYVVGKT